MMQTLIWYIENMIGQIFQMLPCMSVVLILWGTFRPARIRRLSKAGLVTPKRREFVLLLYVLFCAGLCALTLFPYGFWGECMRMLWEQGYVPDIRFPSWNESLHTLKRLPESITPFREILRVNQTLHKIWLSVCVPTTILLPGQQIEVAVQTKLCVAATVIVGKVPSYVQKAYG